LDSKDNQEKMKYKYKLTDFSIGYLFVY